MAGACLCVRPSNAAGHRFDQRGCCLKLYPGFNPAESCTAANFSAIVPDMLPASKHQAEKIKAHVTSSCDTPARKNSSRLVSQQNDFEDRRPDAYVSGVDHVTTVPMSWTSSHTRGTLKFQRQNSMVSTKRILLQSFDQTKHPF